MHVQRALGQAEGGSVFGPEKDPRIGSKADGAPSELFINLLAVGVSSTTGSGTANCAISKLSKVSAVTLKRFS